MIFNKDIFDIFSFFFKTGLRSKRTKLFFFFSFIPVIILIIIKIYEILHPENKVSTLNLFSNIGLTFYFLLFIQLLSLFYGSSVINDEIEDNTLVYLTTSPVSKSSILIGKFMANFVISSVIILVGLFISYLISNFSHFFELRSLKEIFTFCSIGLLAILAYFSLFTLIGSFFKKSVLIGIVFIFGWESMVQFLPGTTQKLTIIHFVKSLLPANLTQKSGFLMFQLKASSTAESVITLLFLSILFLSLSIIIFYKKEYILSDNS